VTSAILFWWRLTSRWPSFLSERQLLTTVLNGWDYMPEKGESQAIIFASGFQTSIVHFLTCLGHSPILFLQPGNNIYPDTLYDKRLLFRWSKRWDHSFCFFDFGKAQFPSLYLTPGSKNGIQCDHPISLAYRGIVAQFHSNNSDCLARNPTAPYPFYYFWNDDRRIQNNSTKTWHTQTQFSPQLFRVFLFQHIWIQNRLLPMRIN